MKNKLICLIRSRQKALIAPVATVIGMYAAYRGLHLSFALATIYASLLVGLAVHEMPNVKCKP